jgi:putative membrane protein
VEPSLLTSWTFEPLQLAPLATVAVAYAVRARTLARRGQPVPTWRIALFATGVALLLLALASPIAVIGEEELFAMHMAQHVLIGDLAPLCLLAGLTGPVLRPVLAFRAVERLRVLANPFVALPLWATLLVVWHLPALYDGAVRHDLVHAFEHAAFFTAGIVVWLPVLETLPAPEWFGTGAKLGYVIGVRLVETVIANVFLWSGSPFYEEYVHAVAPWGIGADQDQALAGAVMMAEGGIVTLVALAWLFLRLAEEGEARQRLLERGLDPRTVRRAVRYGRWRELARGPEPES